MFRSLPDVKHRGRAGGHDPVTRPFPYHRYILWVCNTPTTSCGCSSARTRSPASRRSRPAPKPPAAQWRTLVLLRDNGPLRIGDLATLSRVTQPGMTRLVTQMAEAGLVERTTDPGDSRATLVSATDAGMSALDEWLQVLSAALAPRFADLDEQEWATIRRAADIVDARTRVAEVAR
ncbi:MarR family winged helix-turn-helix transcriptional regulator [Microbacterium hominis]|uniref:MarR family winged helix-turn-helix transcriptional regulator n=1 Tax=Microbacterium hominis TaxID=162426 RepID=UPI001CC3072E|nr:MarR family transcriptional regulator [Microbacterium hominis]